MILSIKNFFPPRHNARGVEGRGGDVKHYGL